MIKSETELIPLCIENSFEGQNIFENYQRPSQDLVNDRQFYALNSYNERNLSRNQKDPELNGEESLENISEKGTDPNSSYFLSESLLGMYLRDNLVGNNLSNWYHFYNPSQAKINIQLQSPANQDYDIYLYQLDNSTLNLNLVARCTYGTYGGIDVVSFVAKAGHYFFSITPNALVNPTAQFVMFVKLATKYDQFEADDNIFGPLKTHVCSKTVTLSRTIDNPVDTDMFILKSTTESTYVIRLNNVPVGQTYVLK